MPSGKRPEDLQNQQLESLRRPVPSLLKNDPEDEEAEVVGAGPFSRVLSRIRSGRMTDMLPPERPTDRPLSLHDRVTWLPDVGNSLAEKLEKLDIKSVYDLMTHYPRSYAQRRRLVELDHGEVQTVMGRVESAIGKTTRSRRVRITEVLIDDDGAKLQLTFFNQPNLSRLLKPGTWIRATGFVEFTYGKFSMSPSKWERIPDPGREGVERWASAGLEPEYPLTKGLGNTTIARLIQLAMRRYGELLPDVLPQPVEQAMRLMPLYESMREIHGPRSHGHLEAARLSLKFREFYTLQAGLALQHHGRREGDGDLLLPASAVDRGAIASVFPFQFTGAQQRATDAILNDLATPGRMNRLLQGDVGSGKTAVCLFASLAAIRAGWQVAVLAPTEILAQQHYRTFTSLLAKQGVDVRLLTGSTSTQERQSILRALQEGRVGLIVGTHALIEPRVKFHRLGLMVVDEQHKFGVRQRAALYAKGNRPHRLVMSATPIPRTLSMTLYGDLDVTIIDELPPGRKPVKTTWVPVTARGKTMSEIDKRLAAGDQAYFIDPLVEPNPDIEIKSATERYEELKRAFGRHGVELLHGQMSPEEKASAMGRFNRGEAKVLAATVVVEVGVDVPAANIMVINHAERFGLSQLHQLRGRIGRGGGEATLYLFGEPTTDDGVKRLTTLCRTTDGFEIAEADLQLRGFGDFLGTRQAGMPRLKIGEPLGDLRILAKAREAAFQFVRAEQAPTIIDAIELSFGRSFQLVDG